jgi:uncharacterized protein (UPF0276 family)
MKVGFALAPDDEFLEVAAPALERADLYEVTPETLWNEDDRGSLVPNGFHARFARLKMRTGKPFVAHGIGLSVGTAGKSVRAHQRRWLDAVSRDHEVFHFLWYTEHLGATILDGKAFALPLPLPMTKAAEAVVAGALRRMQGAVPRVGLENTAQYFLLGQPLEEPAFLRRLLSASNAYLLLDLHNVFTMAVNLGFDSEEYIGRLPLDRVLEIHVSGGSLSSDRWLSSGRRLRLDSHDTAVPEEVWRLLERTVPRCPNVAAVTLERMEGTVSSSDVPLLLEELRRIQTVASA